MSKIVIALGGNALGNSAREQLELVKSTAKNIVDLIEKGNDVVVTHGNGPQVGMINLAMELATKENNAPVMPFAECGAMSQGYIGYHLQQAIGGELSKRKIAKGCAAVVTQVLVDESDNAFDNPTKPIGSFYTKEEAQTMKNNGYQMKEDAGRGYRRVIASPKPLEIIELDTISELIENGNTVIACGGGGIPVVKDTNGYRGVDAVIDKDRTSAKLAQSLNADLLVILTAVDEVCINYGKENQTGLRQITVSDANKYIEEGQFAPGSMLPKIEACLEFVENTNGKAIITSLEQALNSLMGNAGSLIVKEGDNND